MYLQLTPSVPGIGSENTAALTMIKGRLSESKIQIHINNESGFVETVTVCFNVHYSVVMLLLTVKRVQVVKWKL